MSPGARAFCASVVVLAVVLIGLDAALTRAAEQRASEQATILLAAPATVDLRGWPLSLRLLLGVVPVVDVHATKVPTDSGVRLGQLDATLTNVRLRLGDLADGRLPADADDGTFVASLDTEAVRRLLGDLGSAGLVELRPERVRFQVAGLPVEAGVTLASDQLVLTPVSGPPGVPDRLEVPLPELPPGTDVEQVTILDGALRLDGSFVPEALTSFAP